MNTRLNESDLKKFNLGQDIEKVLVSRLNQEYTSPEEIWRLLQKQIKDLPFELNLFIFQKLFPSWPNDLTAGPVCFPKAKEDTNLGSVMRDFNQTQVGSFQHWIALNYSTFWAYMINKLNIKFKKPYEEIVNLQRGIEEPNWLPGATLNISDSCFLAPASAIAVIVYEEGAIKQITYEALNKFSNQIAHSLIHLGYKPGDPIAIDMPMNYFAVGIYLGILKMGGVVVSIADSFSPEEITVRLTISKAKVIFTQDIITRGEKHLPLYEKVIKATDISAIVLMTGPNISLRKQDYSWENFLMEKNEFISIACEPMSNCNILFSSGTTGTPKAIPWKHCTPIKVASDAYLHQDIKPGEVLAWPTNLGWMMGPWLIFASLMNQATIALYDGLPKDQAFGEFVEKAKVTMLGVVPTLVASWRQSKCMENLDWNSIKLFSSTGECSNPVDMFYLMWLAGYKPVIEYCGGTEIGGAYISSTLIENNYPSVCTTPAMGCDFILIDEMGKPTQNGEVALYVPALGLSTDLLNADHYQVYFQNMPHMNGKLLRRHGDQIHQFQNGYYTILGRADDTMNLGAIKTSSAEIERVLVGTPDIIETAAIATMGHGPSELIIFAATSKELNKTSVMQMMQKKINTHLNPLFRISDVVFVKELPKTASNKIMRRVLRDGYQKQCHK